MRIHLARGSIISKGVVVGLSAFIAGALSNPSALHAQSKTIYRETFGYCSGSIGKDAASETNWLGLVSGLPQAKVSNLKVFSYGDLDVGGSVNSSPIGLSQGYSFWFKPVYGLTILTPEFKFPVGLFKNSQALIEYRQRLSGVDPAGAPNKTHLALLVDNVWYISSQYAQQQRPGVWESVQFVPSELTFSSVEYVPGLGPNIPGELSAPLPAAGTVQAFGVFMSEVNGRVRLDNFTIKGVPPSDGSIPTGAEDPDVSLCPASSPDRNGGAGDTPPPPADEDEDDEDDDDSSIDRYRPEPLLPGITPTPVAPVEIDEHGKVYRFCALKEQGRGRIVNLTAKTRSAIMRSINGATLTDLRDRAILALLAQRKLPLGSLVNIKRGDLDLQGANITIATRAAKNATRLRLKKGVRDALNRYLSHKDAPQELAAPLFVSGAIGGGGSAVLSGGLANQQHITYQSAVCLVDLRGIIKERVKQAKVPMRGIMQLSGR
jgi:hypothetical protein